MRLRRISMMSRRSRSPSTRFTDTRDAPMNAASSSCVSVSSSFASPSCCARSSRYLATRLGTSRKMRSSTRSDNRLIVFASASSTTRTAAGCVSRKARKSSRASSAARVSSSAVADADRGLPSKSASSPKGSLWEHRRPMDTETRVRVGEAYVSGALTALEDGARTRLFYELLAEVVESAGLRAYLPHRVTDPVATSHLDPRAVYDIDRAHVAG